MALIHYGKTSRTELFELEIKLIDLIKDYLPDSWHLIPVKALIDKPYDSEIENGFFLIFIHQSYGFIISHVNCIQENLLTQKNEIMYYRDVIRPLSEEKFFKEFLYSYIALKNLRVNMSYDINESEMFYSEFKDIFDDYTVPVMPLLISPFVTKTLYESVSKAIHEEYEEYIPIILSDDLSDNFEGNILKNYIDWKRYSFLNDVGCKPLDESEVAFLIDFAADTEVSLNAGDEDLDKNDFFQYLLSIYEASETPLQNDPSGAENAYLEVVANGHIQSETTINKKPLKEKHFLINFGETGVTFEKIFSPYIKNVKSLRLYDPYIRKEYQLDNLIRFCEIVKNSGGVSEVIFITSYDHDFEKILLDATYKKIADRLADIPIELNYEFDKHLHDRKVVLDNGWVIKIGRGLDIYQRVNRNKSNSDSECEKWPCKKTEVDIFFIDNITELM